MFARSCRDRCSASFRQGGVGISDFVDVGWFVNYRDVAFVVADQHDKPVALALAGVCRSTVQKTCRGDDPAKRNA